MTRTTALALAALVVAPSTASAQRGAGEVRLTVRDATGAAVRATGTIASEATRVSRILTTDEAGSYVATNLPFSVYRVRIDAAGFAPYTTLVEVRSEVPTQLPITLALAPVAATVVVSPAEPLLLDPYRGGSASFIAGDALRSRPSAPPGHSIVDLVDTLPGWFETSNGVLHPRAAEYQVQYVVDGIPLRDNRSPAFAQSPGIDEFESLIARTSGFPAEFGGKLGGVIEISTVRDRRDGFHGVADLQGGSFSTIAGYFSGQYTRRGTSIGASAEGMRTDRYLDPPIEQNHNNNGSGIGFSLRAERTWSDTDRTRAYAHKRHTDFHVPNETLQEIAGQRQSRSSAETLVQASHQHIYSDDLLASAAVMARTTSAALDANEASTPIRPMQDRGFDDLYVSGSLTAHRGPHELKAGGEAIAGSVDERFSSTITAYSVNGVPIFDRDLPATFAFAASRPLREYAAYAQDQMRAGPATFAAGVRFDHYRLAVTDWAVSPRLSGSWFVAPARLVLHASYDRTFETPPIENVLLASSDLVGSLGGADESLPLRPSRGHYFEGGVSKLLFDRARVDLNGYVRSIDNFFDDDLLLNTAVSFPFAFAHADVKGVDASVEVPRIRSMSATLRYSYSVGTGTLPISGGLFLGDVGALLNSSARFPVSEDQRHTLRTRVRYEATPRVAVAGSLRFDSGLPIEVDGKIDPGLLAQQYGSSVVDRVDFARGRVRPSAAIDASVSVSLWKAGTDAQRSVRLQVDAFNLANRLNVINFASLLSGTAIGPRRSATVKLRAEF